MKQKPVKHKIDEAAFNASLLALRQELRVTKDAKKYRSLLAKIAGMCGRGSDKKRQAAIKANKVRWKN